MENYTLENICNSDTIEDNKTKKIDLTELENNIINMENYTLKNICNSDTIVDNKKIDLTELDNIKTYLIDKYSINSKNQKKYLFMVVRIVNVL